MKDPAENSAVQLTMRTPERKDLLPMRETGITKLQAKATILQAQLDEAMNQANDVVGQLASRTQERDELAARLNICEAALAALKADSVKIRAELAFTTQRLSGLVAELDATKLSSAALQAELEALVGDKQTLAATLTEVRADNRRAVALHTQTQTRLKAALATERERSDRLEAHIEALRADHAASLEQARRQTAVIDQSLTQASQERENLSTRLAHAERSRDEVSVNLVQAAAAKEELLARLKETEASRDDFSSKLAQAERSKRDLSEKLRQNDSDRVSLAARLSKADRDKVDLASKLQTAVGDKSSLAARLETAARERDGLEARLAQTDREKAELAASLSAREAERRELQIASEGYLARIDAQSKKPLLGRLFSSSGNRQSLRGRMKGGVASIKLNPDAGVEGFLDRFGPSRMQGWLYRPDRPSEPLRIAFYDGERFICTAVADGDRADVAQKGRMTGRCGFDLPVPQQLLDGRVHRVDIRLAGTAVSLLPCPLLIKLDAQQPKA